MIITVLQRWLAYLHHRNPTSSLEQTGETEYIPHGIFGFRRSKRNPYVLFCETKSHQPRRELFYIG